MYGQTRMHIQTEYTQLCVDMSALSVCVCALVQVCDFFAFRKPNNTYSRQNLRHPRARTQ